MLVGQKRGGNMRRRNGIGRKRLGDPVRDWFKCFLRAAGGPEGHGS